MPRVGVGAIGVVTAEQFIRAFSRERNRNVLTAHLRQEPHGDGASIGAGLIRVVGDVLDRVYEIRFGIQIELVVIRAVMASNFAEIRTLVEFTPAKRN